MYLDLILRKMMLMRRITKYIINTVYWIPYLLEPDCNNKIDLAFVHKTVLPVDAENENIAALERNTPKL